ncbi:MAG: hypothetical protein NTZ59_07600 [Bacteroidetes bacterium]|nr:hypothetical protein [Bacteroidota bacterium]
MKKYLTIIIAVFLFASCKKETSNNSTIDNLFTETKDNVQRNEPVLLSFGDNTKEQNVVWQCNTPTGVTIDNIGDYATVSFANAGTYTVTAKNSNNKQGTYVVTVNNTVYKEFGSNFGLGASKFVNVGIDEDVEFTVHNPSQPMQDSNWSINSIPSTLKKFNADFTAVTVSFQSAGAKYVTVRNGNNVETRTVWVSDSPVNNTLNVPFILGDKLSITPSVVVVNGIKNLAFTSTATYKYKCSSDKIIVDAYSKNGKYILSFNGVNIAASSCSNIIQPNATSSFSNMVSGNTYPFSINYQNKTFTGSISVATDGTFTINFNDNNLISFTTKTVK